MRKAILLFFATIMSMLAHADDAVKIGSIYYNLFSDTKEAEVTSNPSKYTGRVSIPASVTYSGVDYSVTSIGNSAFHGCTDMTSVTIPNSVITYETAAFRGCSGLTSITISGAVTNIGEYAFYGCSGLTTLN